MRTVPVVLVHGNPETSAVWDLLLTSLGRVDVRRLSPPGFGAPLPPSFEATMIGYRDWLIGCLELLAQPVHLVGHDWGGLHVMNVAATRPDLLSSWVSDAAGIYHPGYTWHPLARIWQAPGAGEAWVQAAFTAPLRQRVDTMRDLLGVGAAGSTTSGQHVSGPGRIAERLAAGQDDAMGRAVLTLYRSAKQPAMVEAGRTLEAAAARPGLVIDATADDTTGTSATRSQVAQQSGASVARLDGLGHWWMVQDPHRAAQALSVFWHDVSENI